MCCLFPALLRVGAECINNGHLEKPRRRQWHPTPVLLPGKSCGRRSLEGCNPWSHKESHTTERLHFHFSLSRIGEGNGNPLQCPCLENPRDRGAWWAAVYGVAQSRTRLKRLAAAAAEKPSGRQEKKQTQSKRLKKKKSWRQKEKLSLGATCSGLFSPSLAPAAGFLPPLSPNIPSNTAEAPMSLAIRAGSLIQTT